MISNSSSISAIVTNAIGSPFLVDKIATLETKSKKRKIKNTSIKKPAATLDEKTKRLYILIKNTNETEKLKALKKLLTQHLGDKEVVLVIEDNKKESLRLPDKINPSEAVIKDIKSIFGDERVVFK